MRSRLRKEFTDKSLRNSEVALAGKSQGTNELAHAGVVFQMGLTAGIISVGNCILKRTLVWGFGPVSVCLLAFFAAWSTTHVFVRWQLRNRRFAAIFHGALLRTLKDWAANPPAKGEVDIFMPPAKGRPCKFCVPLHSLVDTYVLPVNAVEPPLDVPMGGYPFALVKNYKDQWKDGSDSSEWMLFIGSVVALIIGILRLLTISA